MKWTIYGSILLQLERRWINSMIPSSCLCQHLNNTKVYRLMKNKLQIVNGMTSTPPMPPENDEKKGSCVCVCNILLPWSLLPTARCLRHTWEVRINDLVLWIFVWVLLPSSFIYVSQNVIFHLQGRNSSSPTNWRENNMINFEHMKRWYMLIWDISGPLNKLTSDKIKRLFQSKFFYFESSPWH